MEGVVEGVHSFYPNGCSAEHTTVQKFIYTFC